LDCEVEERSFRWEAGGCAKAEGVFRGEKEEPGVRATENAIGVLADPEKIASERRFFG